MKSLLFILLTVCFCSLTLVSEEINKKEKNEKKPVKEEVLKFDNSEATKLALEKLNKPITKQWNTSLNELCKDISTELGIKIEIDKAANGEGSIELNVSNLSGRIALTWVLNNFECVGNVKEGVLYITLKEKN